jgi:hypothetical protein
MRKYAAATALAIALTITMLALTVSASVTPANARGLGPGPCRVDQVTAWAHMFGVSRSLMEEGYCFCQCNKDAMRRINTETPTSQRRPFLDGSACTAKCVNAFEAARH